MSDLADQLRAALDRAEAVARAATPGPWRREHPDWPNTSIGNGHRTVIASAVGHGGSWPSAQDAAHIAANGPDVALRTIAAHRRIVGLYEAAEVTRNATQGSTTDAFARGLTNAYRVAVEAIAAIYLERVAEEPDSKLSQAASGS